MAGASHTVDAPPFDSWPWHVRIKPCSTLFSSLLRPPACHPHHTMLSSTLPSQGSITAQHNMAGEPLTLIRPWFGFWWLTFTRLRSFESQGPSYARGELLHCWAAHHSDQSCSSLAHSRAVHCKFTSKRRGSEARHAEAAAGTGASGGAGVGVVQRHGGSQVLGELEPGLSDSRHSRCKLAAASRGRCR